MPEYYGTEFHRREVHNGQPVSTNHRAQRATNKELDDTGSHPDSKWEPLTSIQRFEKDTCADSAAIQALPLAESRVWQFRSLACTSSSELNTRRRSFLTCRRREHRLLGATPSPTPTACSIQLARSDKHFLTPQTTSTSIFHFLTFFYIGGVQVPPSGTFDQKCVRRL